MAETSESQLGGAALEEILRKLERAAMGQEAKTRELTASLESTRKAQQRLEREAQDLVRRLRAIAHDLDAGDAEDGGDTENASDSGDRGGA